MVVWGAGWCPVCDRYGASETIQCKLLLFWLGHEMLCDSCSGGNRVVLLPEQVILVSDKVDLPRVFSLGLVLSRINTQSYASLFRPFFVHLYLV